MKAIALLVLAVALEAGFLFTLALPAAELDAARHAGGARVLITRSPARSPTTAPTTDRPSAASAAAARPAPSRS